MEKREHEMETTKFRGNTGVYREYDPYIIPIYCIPLFPTKPRHEGGLAALVSPSLNMAQYYRTMRGRFLRCSSPTPAYAPARTMLRCGRADPLMHPFPKPVPARVDNTA